MDKRRINRTYILIYTAFFALLCTAAFLPFALDGRCLVGDGDGQSQYILQLSYMGQWLRDALNGFLHGDFSPARFDFAIGMGDDINSVVRFHPLDFLAVFVPVSGTEFLYQFLIFLRLYLAGLTFSIYAFAWIRDNESGQSVRQHVSWGVLAGSMVYMFCGYTFCLGIVHPTYLSPLITLPLLLLGAERMMHREHEHRFALFGAVTAISFISNYYFMYIASVACVIYVFVRFFQIHKTDRVRQFIVLFVRFVSAYVIGAMISCVTLLPVLKRYSGSYRSEHLTKINNLLVYGDKRRYAAWLVNLISPLRASGNGTHLNYAVLVIPAIILLFAVKREREKEEKRGQERVFLRAASLILLAFLLIPAGGFIMAAMNNENNRWVFLIALLCGGVVSFSFSDFFKMGKREKIALAAGCVVYDLAAALSVAWMGLDLYTVSGAVQLTAATVLILVWSSRGRVRQMCALLMCVCIGSCAINGVMTFAKPFGNLPRYYRRAGDSLNWYLDSVYANYLKIPAPLDGRFYRVDGAFSGNKEDNAALVLGYHGVQMYNSVMNASEVDVLMDTANVGLTTMLHVHCLDGRTGAEELAAVRYYMVSAGYKASVPFGYSQEPVYTDSKIAIYENEHPLSLSFGTDQVMPLSEYEKLDYAMREYVCLEAAVVDDEAAASFDGKILTAEEFEAGLKKEIVPVENAVCEEGMEAQAGEDGKLTLKARKNKARYSFDVEMKSGYACYLLLEGVSSSKAGKMNVEGKDIKNRATLLTEDATYTLLRSDYLLNLGTVREDGVKRVSLRPSPKGTFKMDVPKIVYIPLEGYAEKVSKLKTFEMEEETVGDDVITGKVVCDKSRIELFSVPCSEGWSAEVDGQKAELLKADGCWMGLVLGEGSHEIRLIYNTPMQKEGNLISLAGLALYVLGILYFRKRRKIRQK